MLNTHTHEKQALLRLQKLCMFSIFLIYFIFKILIKSHKLILQPPIDCNPLSETRRSHVQSSLRGAGGASAREAAEVCEHGGCRGLRGWLGARKAPLW